MSRSIYIAKAHVSGGRSEGRGRSSDGVLDVDLRMPLEMGGTGGGTNPEQLFAVGYAACFESALGAVARRQRVEIGDVYIDAMVELRTGEDRSFEIAAGLDVTLVSVETTKAIELVRQAHSVCPYSNAIRGNVVVALTANGAVVVTDGANE